MTCEERLRRLCRLAATSGREEAAREDLIEALAPWGQPVITPLGSVLCTLRAPKEGENHLLLEAHMDQIGLVVTALEDGGFLRVDRCGGVDLRVLPASGVTVWGREPIPGVVISTPPHLQKGEAGVTGWEDTLIDTGLPAEELRALVAPGDRITLDGEIRPLLGGLFSAPSLDNRAGCAAVLRAAQLLMEEGEKLSCGLSVAFTAQEEVGGPGALTAAYTLNPTHALSVDVSFGDTPDQPAYKTGVLGKGPMVGFAPILSDRLSRRLIELAREEDIPCQPEIMSGKTGTFADDVAVARGGVTTSLLSVPLRYMHTPFEVVDPRDIEATARLIRAFAQKEIGGKAK